MVFKDGIDNDSDPSDASSNLTQPHDEASSDAKDAKVARAFR